MHIIKGLLTGFILLGCVSTYAQAVSPADSSEVNALLAEGDVFYRRLDNQLAITTYRKALTIDSTSFNALSRLTRTATDLGKDFQAENQKDEAEEAFLEAVKYAQVMERNYVDSSRTHFYLALSKGNLALFKGGREKVVIGREVEKHCKRGIVLDSMDAEILVAYGVFNREVTNSTWMERTFAQALFGRLPEGSKEEAVRLLMHAVELAPNMHVARFELGVSLMAVGRQKEAVTHLKHAETLPAQTTQDNRNRQLATRMLDRMPQ